MQTKIYVSSSTSELRMGLARRETSLSFSVKYFSTALLLLWTIYVILYFCLVFVIVSCASVY